MLGAEAQYCQMEQELQRYLDTYESTHNYDEYHFDLDDIEHDPYVLISILSALHEGEFTLAELPGTLQMLFEKQYILTEEVIGCLLYTSVRGQLFTGSIQTLMCLLRLPFELLHPLRGRDGSVRDRLCGGSLCRLGENGICIHCFHSKTVVIRYRQMILCLIVPTLLLSMNKIHDT